MTEVYKTLMALGEWLRHRPTVVTNGTRCFQSHQWIRLALRLIRGRRETPQAASFELPPNEARRLINGD
jgi:hypothetical protein